jgi:alkylation response protein AidB-like acyl-CoA dehydrogenase
MESQENHAEHAIRASLEALRRRHIEPRHDALDGCDGDGFTLLWHALQETGLTLAGLHEDDGGITLDPGSAHAALQTLGAACPALAVALVAHLDAQALLCEAAGGRWPAALTASGIAAGDALVRVGSPLDTAPAASTFRLERRDGQWRLDGRARVLLPGHAHPLIAAQGTGGLLLCVLPRQGEGLTFTATPSSHGLCLLPFGELRAEAVPLDDAQVFDWPLSGHAANNADALVTALIGGMLDELAQRAGDYALQRVQAGKPIVAHHAVQQLLGSIELARTPVHTLARATFAQRKPGDGSAAAFAMPLLRRAALDAIQVFGGYGYMEDYRVERYLRDANTLETFWVHAARRERELVSTRCAARARGEAA